MKSVYLKSLQWSRFFALSIVFLLFSVSEATYPGDTGQISIDSTEEIVQIRGQKYRIIDDMLFSIDSKDIISKSFRRSPWIDGIIHYEFDDNVDEGSELLFRDAAQTWEARVPGITFNECIHRQGEQNPCENEQNYIHVESSDIMSSSYVGMKGGEQPLRLKSWNRRTILHEIGHALGLNHEQSRGDRDEFVRIIWSNILPSKEYNFHKQRGVHYTEYDFDSLMHYSYSAFGLEDPQGGDNPLTTIAPRPGFEAYALTMGNHDCLDNPNDDCLQASDVEGVIRRYEQTTKASDSCSFAIETDGWKEADRSTGSTAAFYRLLPDRTWLNTPTGHLEIQPATGSTGTFAQAGFVEVLFPGPDEPGAVLYTDEDLLRLANTAEGRALRYAANSGPIHLWFWMDLEADAWTTIEVRHCFDNLCDSSSDTYFTIHASCETASGGALSVSPAAGFQARGEEGGPFEFPNSSYEIANSGSTGVPFEIEISYEGTSTDWLELTPSQGEVGPGETVEVSLSISNDASGLVAGNYFAELILRANGEETERSGTLYVEEEATLPARVSGRVVTSGSGDPVKDVRMDGLPWVVWTNDNGEYSVPVDDGWSGMVSPSKPGYEFSPAQQTFDTVTSSVSADFTGAAQTEIIGGEVIFNGAGLAGVAMNGLPGYPVTDSSGEYTAMVPFQWSGTVTPSLEGFIVSPTSRSYDRVGMSRLEEDYTAVQKMLAVSGNVSHGNSGLEGVLLGGLPGGVMTDSNGNYLGAVPYGWSGEVTPFKHGFNFVPESRTYQGLTSGSVASYSASLEPTQAGQLWIVTNTDELDTALLVASSGDIILVKPGAYSLPNITMSGDNIMLISESGSDQTIIEINISARFNTDNVIIDGFTFRNLMTTIEPVELTSVDNFQIRNCRFYAHSSEFGIRITSGNNILIERNEFMSGDGVLLRYGGTTGSLTIRNNVFRTDDGAVLGGGNSDLDIVIENNRFEGQVGKGLSIDSGFRSVRIESNLFANNNIALELDDNPGALIKNSVFYANSRGADFGGSAQATFENAIFLGNGRSIDVGSSATVSVHHTMYWDNSSMWYGSGTFIWDWGTIWEEDPQLADPENGDFHLIAGSPAFGRGSGGVDLGIYGGPRGDDWITLPAMPSPPTLETLEITGASEAQPDTSFVLRAEAQYDGGYYAKATGVAQWTSSAPALLESQGEGRCLAHLPGGATIRATFDGESDSHDVTIVGPNLSISLSDDVDPVEPGDLLVLTAVIANEGPSTARNTQLTTELPGELSFATATPLPDVGVDNRWTIGDIAAGSAVSIEIAAQVSDVTIDGTKLTSRVTATCDHDSPALATEATDVVGVSDLFVEKQADVSSIDPGSEMSYTIFYGNTGTGAATNVALSEVYSPSITFRSATPPPDSGNNVWLLGGLNPGASGEITVTVGVDPQAVDTIFNRVTIFGDQPDPTPENNVFVVSTDVNPWPDLSLMLTDLPSTVLETSSFQYTWRLTNLGQLEASAVELFETLPVGIGLLATTPSQGTCSGVGPFTCQLGNLAPGAVVTITVEALAGAAGSQTIEAQAFAAESELDSSNNQANGSLTVNPAADLQVTLVGEPAVASPGDTVTYTVTAYNRGPSVADDVTVTDDLPGEVVLEDSSPSQGTCTGTTTVICSLGSLANNGSAEITLITRAVSAGSTTNSASVTSAVADPSLQDNEASVTTMVCSYEILPENILSAPAGGTGSITVRAPDGCPWSIVNESTFVNIIGSSAGTGDGIAMFEVLSNGTGASRSGTLLVADQLFLVRQAGAQIAVGSRHSAFLQADGTVLSWGTNANGQLGDGTLVDRSWPEAVEASNGQPISSIGGIDSRNNHTVAVELVGGRTWAWGLNSRGQLGDGTNVDRPHAILVQDETGNPLDDVTAVSTGTLHSLALRSDGTVFAWGDNSFGQLGDGTTNDRWRANPVLDAAGLPLDRIVAIAAGSQHNLALRADGKVLAWGRNHWGQLGDGTLDDAPTPIPVLDINSEALLAKPNLAAGSAFSLIEDPAGILLAWGRNVDGELGDGTTNPREWPAPVVDSDGGALTATTGIASGENHCLAITAAGSVVSWGSNRNGQLGDGSTTNRQVPAPVTLADGTPVLGVVQTEAGENHSLALRDDGVVLAWGANSAGQLGDGTSLDRHYPTVISGDGAELSLSLIALPEPVAALASLTYTFEVRNGGRGLAVNSLIEQTLPPGTAFESAGGSGWACEHHAGAVTCSAPELALGPAPMLTVVVTAPAEAQELQSTAVISSTSPDPLPANNEATVSSTTIAVADLAISKSDSVDPILAGALSTYVIGVANNGPSVAEIVRVVDTLPPELAFAGVSGQGWSCSISGQDVSCETPELPVGAAQPIMLQVTTPPAAGVVDNTACVSATSLDPNTLNNCDLEATTVLPSADLEIALADSSDPVAAGAGLDYTLQVANSGPGTSTDVSVTAVLPAELSSVMVPAVAGWSCITSLPTVTCTRPSLEAQVTTSITINATAPPDPATLTAVATVVASTTDPQTTNNTASESTAVTGLSDLELNVMDAPDPVTAGELLSYTLTVTNNGPTASSGGQVVDMLPDELSFASSPDSCSTPDDPGTVICTFGSLASGSAVSMTFTVRVAPEAVRALANTLTVTGHESDPVTSNNSATESTTIENEPPTVLSASIISGSVGSNLSACETVRVPARRVTLTFSEVLNDPVGDSDSDDVTNPDNYMLLAAGDDHDFDTSLCATLFGDDILVTLDNVAWEGGSRTATLSLAHAPLADGLYRLIACGSTSLYDLSGNPLDGDANGTGGDDYLLDFREDAENALDNGHVDCDLDPWVATSTNPSEITYCSEDVDGSDISGSVCISNLTSSSEFSISQCASVNASGPHELSARVRFAASPGVRASISGTCEYFSETGCAGSSLGLLQQALPLEDTNDQWATLERSWTAPRSSVSAFCTFNLSVPSGDTFDANLDYLTLRVHEEVFRDGFESGDSTAWSETIP